YHRMFHHFPHVIHHPDGDLSATDVNAYCIFHIHSTPHLVNNHLSSYTYVLNNPYHFVKSRDAAPVPHIGSRQAPPLVNVPCFGKSHNVAPVPYFGPRRAPPLTAFILCIML